MANTKLIPGLLSREIAFNILEEHYKKQTFLKDLFAQSLSRIPEREIGLVQEIIYGVVRWQALLDYNISLYITKSVKGNRTKTILRLTAYQIFFLSTPDYASLSIGVELLKKHGHRSLAQFGNALFRKLQKNGLKKMEGNKLKALAINYSHPLWLVQKWHKALPPALLLNMLKANNTQQSHWVRLNQAKAPPLTIQNEIEGVEVEQEATESFPYFLVSKGISSLLNSSSFKKGLLALQSPSSFFACQLLNWKPKESILDMCAAPGGKSARLIEQFKDSSSIICADSSFNRLNKIKDTQQRLGHTQLLPVVMDGNRPAFKKTFDKIFIDAPCSNLGVIRRKPEIKWRQTEQSIQQLISLQKKLLQSAASLTHLGSVIVYATCSPDKEETQNVVQSFLKENPEWQLEPAQNFIPKEYTKEDYFWIYPGETTFDGFFAARLVRKATLT